MKHSGVARGVWAILAAQAAAQLNNWPDNQINTTICTWKQPRAALLRDTVYLDGGNIWWLPGLDDGTWGGLISPGGEGMILSYNLSEAFSKDTNTTGILVKKMLSKALGGSGGSSPDFEDGGMLANDDQFFLYGGSVLRNEKLYDEPDADDIIAYRQNQYGDDKSLFTAGFDDTNIDDDVTRYVAYGAAVNAPSENMAWYFSGLTSPTEGPFYQNYINNKTEAIKISNRMISVDMSEQYNEKWSNSTLDDVKGRSNAEVVWVPVGEQGILVVLGGVVYPEWPSTSRKSEDAEASEDESPAFMRDIDVYDIANDKWYQQSTEDGPKTRARGCAVLAQASDSSSFNIYYYGGYDGIHFNEAYHDDVWVLSLPSFTWTQLNEGKDIHARAGHKCFSPYPDQMMVFGGYTPATGTVQGCLQDGPVVIFNTTSGEWMDSYDPADFGEYGVPDKVRSAIGGDASGGATATAPPDGWATDALGEVFSSTYDMDKITTYYPYPAASETSRPDIPDDNNDDGGGGGGLPNWVAPVLGVVLGLILVTSVVVLFCLWRRRKIFKNRGPSEPGTEDAGMRILSWMRGQQPAEKAPTVTSSDETPASPEMDEARVIGTTPSPFAPTPSHYEMEDTQLVELGDTSPPAELHDTGLSPLDVIQKHSRFGSTKSRSPSNPSYSSFSGGAADYNSTVSHSSGIPHSNTAQGERMESPPPPGASPEPASERVTSGVSSVTEREAGHLRQISETTVSSTGMHPVPVERPAVDRAISESTEPVTTPISPPTAVDAPGEDYLSSREVVSPMRRSAFHEHEEDLGKP